MGNLTVLNVKDDFGAVGNEDSDDRIAIQTALDTAASLAGPGSKLNGVIVFFPPGIYKISGTGIVIPRISNGSIIIRGSGIWASHISASENTFPFDVPVVDFSPDVGNPTGY